MKTNGEDRYGKHNGYTIERRGDIDVVKYDTGAVVMLNTEDAAKLQEAGELEKILNLIKNVDKRRVK